MGHFLSAFLSTGITVVMPMKIFSRLTRDFPSSAKSLTLAMRQAMLQRTSSIKTKENRQAWWKERYDLDQRLQELLKDAEHCWIGGFLGMFSMTKTFKHLMENFSNQFLKILRTHLPSRNWVMGGGRRRGVGSKRGLVPHLQMAWQVFWT